MSDFVLSKEAVKRYLLYKQGLFGAYQFQAKKGILDFIDRAGCVQFDPVDVVGRNADLTLQARVEHYDKNHLYELLYDDRLLVDGHDKMMSIYSVKDWHHLQACRLGYVNRQDERYAELAESAAKALRFIEGQKYVSSIELESDEHIRWGYGSAKKSRAVLDLLFYQGKIIVHHKERSRRFYAARKHYFADDKPVFKSEEEQLDWHVLRRISAVGLLWNRNSDALLGIVNLNAKSRAASFDRLLKDGRIKSLTVTGLDMEFYIKTEDVAVLEFSDKVLDSRRIEFIAPLDPLLWDRKLIGLLFGFDYKWEIYTPKEKRIYGHYVLPIIYGTDFVGRVAFTKQAAELRLDQIWFEKDCSIPPAELAVRLRRFAKFNDLVYR